METNSKWYLNSTTIRGGLVVLIPVLNALLHAFGVEITVDEWSPFIDGIAGLSGVVGFFMILAGRINAREHIRFKK